MELIVPSFKKLRWTRNALRIQLLMGLLQVCVATSLNPTVQALAMLSTAVHLSDEGVTIQSIGTCALDALRASQNWQYASCSWTGSWQFQFNNDPPLCGGVLLDGKTWPDLFHGCPFPSAVHWGTGQRHSSNVAVVGHHSIDSSTYLVMAAPCGGNTVGFPSTSCRTCTTTTDCSAHANSVTDDGFRDNCVCSCTAGWSGATCNIRICHKAVDCVNSRTRFVVGTYPLCECNCVLGYGGATCRRTLTESRNMTMSATNAVSLSQTATTSMNGTLTFSMTSLSASESWSILLSTTRTLQMTPTVTEATSPSTTCSASVSRTSSLSRTLSSVTVSPTGITMSIPVVPWRPPAYSGVGIAIRVGQVLSFSGVLTSSTAGRVALVFQFLSCGSSADVSGLFGVELGSPCASRTAQGAVVMNVVVLCACCVLVTLLAQFIDWHHAAVRKCSWISWRSLATVCFPSILFPMFVATVPSMILGTIELLSVSSSDCWSTIVLSSIGTLFCGFGLLALCFGMMHITDVLTLSTTVHDEVKKSLFSLHFPKQFTFLFSSSCVWLMRERNAKATAIGRSSRGLALFLNEHRVLWYPVYDLAQLFTLSALSGVAFLGQSTSECAWFATALVALLVVQFIVVAAAKPFRTMFSTVYTLVTLFLTVISATLLAVMLYNADTLSPMILERLALAAMVCSGFVVGISFVRNLMDVASVLPALQRLLQPLLAPPPPPPPLLARDENAEKTLPTVEVDVCEHGVSETPLHITVDEEAGMNSQHFLDSYLILDEITEVEVNRREKSPTEEEFWDSSGNAILDEDLMLDLLDDVDHFLSASD